MVNNRVLENVMRVPGSSETRTAVPALAAEAAIPRTLTNRPDPPTKPAKRPVISAHPLLFGGLFVLMGFKQLLPYSDLKELAWNLVAVLACIVVVQFILALVVRQPHKAALAASLSVIFFCFFGDFKGWCEQHFSGVASARWLLPFAAVVFLLLLWWLIRTRRNLLVLHRYLNVLSGVLLLAAAVNIAFVPPAAATSVNTRAQIPLHLGPKPPDIYYILVDGYTSPESLKTYWRYDNSPFTDFLTRKGFQVVKDAHGNATFTPQCLSTYLNMDYPAPSTLSMQAQTAYYSRIIETAEAPARLKASGYEVTALSIFGTAGQPRYYFYPKISAPTLANVIWNKTAAGYLTAFQTRASLGDSNLKIISMLPGIAAHRGGRPKFIYAHLMMPHPPYLFDPDGNRIQRGMGMDDESPDLYLGQMIYENKLLTNAIAGILKNSKTPPIIVLQGDHGYRGLHGAHQQEEASTILNALYLPGSQDGWLYPGITPVNTFRMIFNHYFCEHYARLPERIPQALSPFVNTLAEK